MDLPVAEPLELDPRGVPVRQRAEVGEEPEDPVGTDAPGEGAEEGGGGLRVGGLRAVGVGQPGRGLGGRPRLGAARRPVT